MVQSLNRGIHAGPSAKKVPRPQCNSHFKNFHSQSYAINLESLSHSFYFSCPFYICLNVRKTERETTTLRDGTA